MLSLIHIYLPLMCRITVDGEIKQFSCKMGVPPRLWDVKNSRASGKSVEADVYKRQQTSHTIMSSYWMPII